MKRFREEFLATQTQPADDEWMGPSIPERLTVACRSHPDRQQWLARVPTVVRQLERRWSLSVGVPFDGPDVTCSWVAPVCLADGRSAVLKLGMPHFEAEHESEGLRFWNGDPAVYVLDADKELGSVLLERCEPGIALRTLPEAQQDVIIAGLLRRLWRTPSAPHTFRPLSAMIACWSEESTRQRQHWPDRGLVSAGLGLLRELAEPAATDVLLATDLHAGNVLQSQREPWLVIDPKPFVGDPAYDATQHLFNCEDRLRSDPFGTVRRFADLLGIGFERVRLWMFARAAADPRDDWATDWRARLARALAPA